MTAGARPRPAEWPSDTDLQREVLEELAWSPAVDESGIGVSVDHGVVHLDGRVRDLAEDVQVRKAALRVRGAVGVVDRLTTAPSPVGDDALLDAVLHALRHAAGLPADVRPAVRDGVVLLTGTCTWEAERKAAEDAVRHLAGVRAVRNGIVLTARPAAEDAARRIREALVRDATIDADAIRVRADGTELVLEGSVRSAAERRQAALAAWASPAVTRVHNRIAVTG